MVSGLRTTLCRHLFAELTTCFLNVSLIFADVANSTYLEAASLFVPDARFFRPDADLYLIFLSGNGVYFQEPNHDPWYRGFVPGKTITYSDGENATAYRPDEAASPLGCIQKHQYCNADRQCGELASFDDAMATAATLFNASQDQIWGATNVSGAGLSRFAWFEYIMWTSYDLDILIQSLGIDSLTSRQYFDEGFIAQIPDNQWQLDVTHWWATLLAAKQAAFVNVARGPTDSAMLDFKQAPQNSYMQDMCNNQVCYLLMGSSR